MNTDGMHTVVDGVVDGRGPDAGRLGLDVSGDIERARGVVPRGQHGEVHFLDWGLGHKGQLAGE